MEELGSAEPSTAEAAPQAAAEVATETLIPNSSNGPTATAEATEDSAVPMAVDEPLGRQNKFITPEKLGKDSAPEDPIVEQSYACVLPQPRSPMYCPGSPSSTSGHR